MVERDGTVHRRDHQWLKLLNSRPIRRVADPRIDFAAGRDELIIHTARTHLPNGEILPVPDYSFNIAGPNDLAGWPEYAEWQQQIVSFSGIEDNVVLEMDYEIVTPPGVLPWIEADVRLNDDHYPTIERVVSVTLPHGTTFHHKAERTDPAQTQFDESSANGAVTYRWRFDRLAATRDESQSPPWEQRCGRLRFTTSPDTARWASTMLDRIDQAGRPDDAIQKFAQSTVEDETTEIQRIRKIAEKIHDSFNFITSPKAMQSLSCRSGADVFQANYGNPLESAALCLAMIRALDMSASPAVGVEARSWNESDGVPPTGSAFAGAVVVVDLPDGPVYVHPRDGVFDNPGSWGRRWLFSKDDAGTVQRSYVYARGEQEPGELHIAGKVTVDSGGEATGELRFSTTGAFFDPANLETADAQKALVKDFVGRVLSDFDVPGHSVVTLSDETFKATASVASNGVLKDFGESRVLKLGDGPAFLPDVPMPLARSQRLTDVKLAGRFRETVDLTIELPEGWKASVVPASLTTVQGDWGSVTQTTDVSGRNIRLHRDISVTQETVTPCGFDALRMAVNNLRANKSLLVVFGKPSASDNES
jgi:hypothetical protein